MKSAAGKGLRVALAYLLTGCVGTQVANLNNLALPVPAFDARAAWQSDLSRLFDDYDRAPVLAPEDPHLEPLVGGLTTLSYFGADPKRRVSDQEIAPRGPATGEGLEAACIPATETALDAARVVFATSELPAFVPVWIPLSISGEAAPVSARCDGVGNPSGAGAEGQFCMFGRLALQPGEHRPLVVVVHGIFDSGAQDYVQRMAAELYRLGNSVLVPDMRDHGDTLRAAPAIATTLGILEGPDLLAVARTIRRSCEGRVGRVGIAGVSGGGLDAIRAFTLDRSGTLDAGVIAISPLVDVPEAIRDLSQSGSCAATQAIELGWADDVAIAAATGVAFFGGAALVQALEGQRLDTKTAIAAGGGAGAGLLGALAIDAWFDGGTTPCVSENAIAQLVEGALQVRWRALRDSRETTASPAGRRIAPSAITLDSYVRERARFLAEQQGVRWRQFAPRDLANDLRAALELDARPEARLLVIGAEDDPITRFAGFREFSRQVGSLPQVYVRAVRRGGHGAMSIVQPTVMTAVFDHFFHDRTGT